MKISPEVLAVLSALSIEGTQVRIAGQLDRGLYTQTNKVLEACGGKWNRGAKAHLFDADARERIELVLTTGEVQTKNTLGFFETPPALARELVKLACVEKGDHVLEPSAGLGAIVKPIKAAGGIVTAVEIDTSRFESLLSLSSAKSTIVVGDFMEFDPAKFEQTFDRVVMNPPFCKAGKGDHLDHVLHAYDMLRDGGVLVSVMPSGVTFRNDRRYRDFRAFAETHGEIDDLPEDSFKASGTRVNTCTVRLEK